MTLRIESARASGKFDELPSLYVSVTNRGHVPVEFGPTNVTVASGDQPVRIYNAYELQLAIGKEGKLDGLAAEVRGTSKIQSTTMGLPYAGSGRPAILGQMDAFTDRTDVRYTEAKRRTQLRFLLYPNTVQPGTSLGGVVKLHAEQIALGKPLAVTVTVDGEAHEFAIDVTG